MTSSISYQNIFGTDGARGLHNEFPLTPKDLWSMGLAAGQAFLQQAPASAKSEILLARDTRISGLSIAENLALGFQQAGVQVKNCGVLPTPALAALIRRRQNVLGGTVISASHNPPEFNGVKFFDPLGQKAAESWERKVEALMEKNTFVLRSTKLDLPLEAEAKADYLRFLRSSLSPDFSLRGVQFVLDCAEGASYEVAPEIFQALDAEVTVLHHSPNGKNINVNCGALHTQDLCRAVLNQKAWGGVAFDGDADRLQLIDETGELLDGDVLLAMAAAYLKAQGRLKANTVVTTVMANLGFMKKMREAEITVHQTAVGDRSVWQGLLQTEAVLGGEQSGHIIFREFLPTGDGILSALLMLQIARAQNRPLSYFRKNFQKFPQVLKNLRVPKKIAVSDCPSLTAAMKDAEKTLGSSGRVLVRYSGTEPLLRVMVEAESDAAAHDWTDKILEAARLDLQA